MEQEKKIILIAGPTAAGKSDLAVKIARHFDGEIINADSMQIYKEISILNSKPSIKNTKLIKHHLYSFLSIKKIFSTGHWLQAVKNKIKELQKRNKIPIIVGGTGLYFKALTEGLVKIPEIPDKTRSEVRKLHNKLGQKEFFNKLIKIDPLAKKFILPTDSQRSMRVYEVKKFTNRSLFEFIKSKKKNYQKNTFKKIFINTPRELLHKNIEKRVEKMFANGAVEEVKKFLKMKISPDLSSNKIIGIREIKDYLKEKTSITIAKQLIAIKTRQYAKRQFTWSRGHMKSWEMIYSSNINDLVKKAINKIS